MEDRQLYEQILGIGSPWRVKRVELSGIKQEVHIYLEHEEVRWPWFSPNRPMTTGLSEP